MPETANAGLITLRGDRREAAVLASATADGPFAAPAPAVRRRRRRQWGWYRLVSPVAVVALWQLLSSAGLIPADKLPPPTTVWHTLVDAAALNAPGAATAVITGAAKASGQERHAARK